MKDIFLNVFKILDSESKKQGLFALMAAVLFGIIELVGIGSLFLFMQVVVLDSADALPGYLKAAYDEFGFENYRVFIFFMGGVTVLTVLLRSLVFMIQKYLQNNFVGSLQVKLTARLFSKYICQNVEFFLVHTTSRLAKNLIQEVPRLCGNTVFSLVEVISNFIVLVMIVVFLFLKEPVLVTLGCIGLLIFYVSIFKLLKDYIRKKGAERVLLSEQLFTSIQQALAGVREIKLYNAFDKALATIKDSAEKQKTIFVFFDIYQQTPRQIIEIIIAAAIVTYILLQYDTGSAAEIIPQLTLLAAGIYRLMPKFDAIMNNFMRIKFDHNIFSILESHLAMPEHGDQNKNRLKWTKQIEIKDITYAYPETQDTVLGPVSLSIQKGEIIGIQGTSGSGKSTFLEILCNLLPVKGGAVFVDDHPVDFEHDTLNIAYIPQEPSFFEGSILENIAFGVPHDQIDKGKIEKAAVLAGIHDFIKTLPDGYNQYIGERAEKISGGQKQRIALARAIYKDSDLLVLDEVTNALDKATEKKFMDNLMNIKGDRTIVIVSHNPICYEYCDRVVKLEQGQIVETT